MHFDALRAFLNSFVEVDEAERYILGIEDVYETSFEALYTSSEEDFQSCIRFACWYDA